MPFIVKPKGKKFLVINRETGTQKGHFVKKGEAVSHARSLNKRDDNYRPNSKIFIDGK